MANRICILGVFALMLGLDGVAAKDYWTVIGEGQGSCGNWTKAQAHRPHIGGDAMMPVTIADIPLSAQTAWVQGFLSAFNHYGGATAPNIVDGIDANGVFAWIDNYCAEHPLDTIASASVALVSERSKRGRQ